MVWYHLLFLIGTHCWITIQCNKPEKIKNQENAFTCIRFICGHFTFAFMKPFPWLGSFVSFSIFSASQNLRMNKIQTRKIGLGEKAVKLRRHWYLIIIRHHTGITPDQLSKKLQRGQKLYFQTKLSWPKNNSHWCVFLSYHPAKNVKVIHYKPKSFLTEWCLENITIFGAHAASVSSILWKNHLLKTQLESIGTWEGLLASSKCQITRTRLSAFNPKKEAF